MKISIRFFDNREVRAVWDDERSRWWFSVLDIVGVLNEESDYTKTRNYCKYLKAITAIFNLKQLLKQLSPESDMKMINKKMTLTVDHFQIIRTFASNSTCQASSQCSNRQVFAFYSGTYLIEKQNR
jgi:hypothetical protein